MARFFELSLHCPGARLSLFFFRRLEISLRGAPVNLRRQYKMDTLFDRLVNLETTLDSLRTQERDRSRAVDAILKEMETINENMDRKPEARQTTALFARIISWVCARFFSVMIDVGNYTNYHVVVGSREEIVEDVCPRKAPAPAKDARQQ